MSDPLHIISLGAGVQSSTMALMAAAGEITPMPTAAIFADTQDEPQSVYRWLEWLEKQLPYPVYRVTAGRLSTASLTVLKNRKTEKGYYSNRIPAFVKGANGTIAGKIERHCTRAFKIFPIFKRVRAMASDQISAWRREKSAWAKMQRDLFRLADCRDVYEYQLRVERDCGILGMELEQYPVTPAPVVVQWIGISLDEVHRMKFSRDPWCAHRWPLIEKEMKRPDCLRWMEAHGFPKPPRSACIFCPYKSNHEWRRLLLESPTEFTSAAAFEQQLQELHASIVTPGKIKGIPFLHRSLKPLDQVDFSTDIENGQGMLAGFGNECEGMCGV